MDVRNLKKLLLSPIVFYDLYIEIIDVIEASHQPESFTEYHKHPWYEFNYLTQGQMNVTINNDEFIVTKDNFVLIPPNTMHMNRWSVADDGVCIRFSVQRNPYAKNGNCFDELSAILSLPHLFGERLNISALSESKSLYSLQSAFVNLLFRISEIFEPTAIVDKLSVSANISNQVIMYLREYYKTKIYVADIAKALNMSYRTLSKHFKTETGMSIIEKLTEIRLNEAKRLLQTTSCTLAQIAEMTGFEDESYFSKTFAKYMCCPPGSFRK